MGEQDFPGRISRRCLVGAAAALTIVFVPLAGRAQDTAETIELSPAQRQLIYASLSRQTHQSTAAPATFQATVGATVPEGVELGTLPDTVVEVVPQVRGLVFALVGGQVLLVDPKTRRIAAAITQSST